MFGRKTPSISPVPAPKCPICFRQTKHQALCSANLSLYTSVMQSYVFLLSLVALITPLSASSLHLTVPTSNLIPTPSTLPPSSHATLTTANLTLTAPIRRNNVFSFYMLPRGSYLCDVNSRDHAFAPFRVDVNAQGVVEVWQTFRGNEWDNRGERVAAGRDVSVDVKVVGKKNFYESRGGCKCYPMHNAIIQGCCALKHRVLTESWLNSLSDEPIAKSYDIDCSLRNGHDGRNALSDGE